MEDKSERFTLNKQDGKQILKGLAIALGGALLTYLSEIIIKIDFGQWTPVAVALFSAGINAGRKLLADV